MFMKASMLRSYLSITGQSRLKMDNVENRSSRSTTQRGKDLIFYLVKQERVRFSYQNAYQPFFVNISFSSNTSIKTWIQPCKSDLEL